MAFLSSVFKSKKFLSVFFVVLLFLFSVLLYIRNSSAAAHNCYWVGDAADSVWSSSTHWADITMVPGTCAGIGNIPSAETTVIFDGTNDNTSSIDAVFSVAAVTISSGYSGTVTIQAGQSLTTSGTFTINDGVFTTGNQNFTSGAFTMGGGTFNGGTSTIVFNGHYTLTEGVFNAGTSTTFKRSFIHTVATGTFAAGATTIFNSGNASYFDVVDSETFNDVQFNSSNDAYGLGIMPGKTIIVDGDLTLTNGFVNTGTIDFRGDNITQASTMDGGTAIIDFGDNVGSQIYTINGGSGPQVRFDNSADASDEVILSTDATLRGILITADFGNANTVPMTYNNHTLTLAGTGGSFNQASGIFSASPTMVIAGSFTLSDGVFNAGSTITFGHSFTHTTETGTYNEGATTIFATGNLVDFNVNVTESFNNVEINTLNSGYGIIIPAADTMVVLGNLTLTKGYVGTGVIDVRGDITQAATYGGNYRNNAIIDFGNDAVAQTYTINGGIGPTVRFDDPDDANDEVLNNSGADFTLTGGITITAGFGNANTVPMTYGGYNLAVGTFSQASGTFNSPASSMTTAVFTLTDGIFNAAATTTHNNDFTHNTATGTYNEGATTIFASGRNWATYDFYGSEAFNDVQVNTYAGCAFAIANGDAMIVNGNLTLTNGGYKNSTGYIDVKGNATVDSTFDADAGRLYFSGSGNQNYTINGPQPTGVLTFAKTTGDMTIINSTTTAKILTLSPTAQSFENLYLSATNTADLTLAGATNNPAVNISGNLDFTGVAAGTEIITAGTGAWSVGGNVDFTGGTFTHSNGILNLNGSATGQTLTTATNSLNNLTVSNTHADGVSFADSATASGTFTDITQDSKLTFADGATYAFGSITVNGAVDHPITMTKGAGADGHWYFNVAEVNPTVTYVAVDNSDATGSTDSIDATTGGIDNGSNINWDFPATVPDSPTNVSAVAGNTQATVSFTAPINDGGSPITSYTVTSTPGSITATGGSSPIIVTGLTNGVSYTFTVHATNAIGDSVESSPSIAITPATVPDAPTIGVATTGAGVGEATVTFTPPANDGGSPITSYIVTSAPGGFTKTGAGSPITVTGLTNGTAYTFTVHATNANGDSVESAASNSITTFDVPGAPTIGVATAGNTEASITFTPPVNDGGTPITGYTITSTPGSFTGTGAGSPIVVSGLTNGTNYTFTVHATNIVGDSAESVASDTVTPVTVPGAPTGVSATLGDTLAIVTFTPPNSNGGSAITSYTVTSTPGSITATGGSSPIIVTGLTNGVSYTFTVHATNVVGDGPESAPSNAVEPSADQQSAENDSTSDGQDNPSGLVVIKPQTTSIIETDNAERSSVKKDIIDWEDFSYYAVLSSSNILLHPNKFDQIEVFVGSDILVEIPADVFAKKINVITISTPTSAYLMNVILDKNKYQAVLPMPSMKGDFDLDIIIVFEDGSIQNISRGISVNPRGYVYSMTSAYFGLGKKQEIRIPDAEVTLYHIDNGEGKIWDSKGEQDNPAYTGKPGEYNFWTPAGDYYLVVEKAGYKTQKTEIFTIDNNLISRNIQVRPKFPPWWWLILAAVLVLILFIIGREKKRKKVN